MATKNSVDVEATKIQSKFDELAEIESFDSALKWLAEKNVDLITNEDIEQIVGDGFQYVTKNALVNIPFVILRADHRMSPTWDVPMVTVYAMTATNKRVKFIDFGSGFREQLSTYESRTGRSSIGLLCKNGLVANTYDVQDSEGNEIKATTFRINFGD